MKRRITNKIKDKTIGPLDKVTKLGKIAVMGAQQGAELTLKVIIPLRRNWLIELVKTGRKRYRKCFRQLSWMNFNDLSILL